MQAFIDGLSFPLRAVRFIASQPMLWRYIVIPIALNILVGFVLYATLLWAGVRAIEALLADWPELIAWFVWLLLIIVLFVGIGYLMVRFGVVIGSPFYSRLSELIEEQLRGVARTTSPASPASIAYDLFRALLFELNEVDLLAGVWDTRAIAQCAAWRRHDAGNGSRDRHWRHHFMSRLFRSTA
jgi:CysZ protein